MADRLYFRTRWIFNLHNNGAKYLLRLSSHRHLSFTKESQKKIETMGKNSTVIDCEVVLKIDTNKKGKPKHLLHCRYVEIRRIEQETLRFLTNLSYDFADSEEIAQLYLLRWGIETDFRLFKGQDHLPIVISRKENTVRQEILLRVLAHNSIRYVQAEACKTKNKETGTANPIIDGNSEKHAIYNKRAENNEKQVISETNENDTCPQQKKSKVIHIWMKRHISMNREILPVDLRMGISTALIIGNILYYSLYPGKRNPEAYIQLLNDILSQEILVKPGRHYPRRGRKYPKIKRKRRGDIKAQYERRKARKKWLKQK